MAPVAAACSFVLPALPLSAAPLLPAPMCPLTCLRVYGHEDRGAEAR